MRLAESTLDALREHALEIYPHECCGAVIRNPDGRDEVVRMVNIQDRMRAEDPQRFPRPASIAYYPDPADLKAALDRSERPGHRLVAFYHSHPDHDAYFSDEDVAQATPWGEASYPDALQIVISVYGTEVRAIKAFAWSSADQTFLETPIEAA